MEVAHTVFLRTSRVQIDTRCHEVSHVQQAADRDTQQAFDGKTRNDAKGEAGTKQRGAEILTVVNCCHPT